MRITELVGFSAIGLAFLGIAYTWGADAETGEGNPRPKVCLELEQYKKDMTILGQNLDEEFAKLRKELRQSKDK